MRHGQICTTCSSSSTVSKGTHHMTQSKHLMLYWGSRLLSSMITVLFLHLFFSAISCFVGAADHVITGFISFCSYVTVSRSFFSKEFGAARDIGDGLECWRGYYQSLRPTQMGLSLNIGTDLLRKILCWKLHHCIQFQSRLAETQDFVCKPHRSWCAIICSTFLPMTLEFASKVQVSYTQRRT